MHFLTRWLAQREPVHIAKTPAEREAIFRFRYDIYVKEFGRQQGGPDHERQLLHDQDDEADYTTLLYTGTPADLTSTMRLRHWRAGEVPEKDFSTFSMQRIPNIAQLRTAELGRLMIRRDKRGKLLLVAHSLFSYRYLVEQLQTDVAFLTASPGLVHHYRQLGYRPYGGQLLPQADGLAVPLINICSDYEFFRRVDSFLAPIVRNVFRGSGRTLDMRDYAQLLDDGRDVVRVEADDVLQELESAMVGSTERFAVSELDPRTVSKLVKYGYVLNVPKGILLSREGFGEDELFFVLAGEMRISRNGHEIRRVMSGGLLGEMAFFLPESKRTADIHAAQDSRLLVLRGNALRRLLKESPESAIELLLLAGRTMAEKLKAAS